MSKILIADSLPAFILEKYNKSDNVTIDNKSGISKEDLLKEIETYDKRKLELNRQIPSEQRGTSGSERVSKVIFSWTLVLILISRVSFP